MKKLSELVKESKGEPIDDQWINDEKPIQTKDGRVAIVKKVDLKEVPNVIYGVVKWKDKLLDYEWLEDGTCRKALDSLGNPKKPDESDNLVKGI